MTQPSCYICPMPIVEQSCVLRESPERVWSILSDLRNWSYLFSTRTWLRRIKPSFELLEGTGADMRFQVSYGRSFREKWMMTEWRPPEYLAAAGRSFLYRCPLHDAGLAFALAAIGPLETRVDCCLELEPFPPRRLVKMRPVFSVEKEMRNQLVEFSARLTVLLERA